VAKEFEVVQGVRRVSELEDCDRESEQWFEEDYEQWLEDDDEWEEIYDYDEEKRKSYAAVLKER
jgi:hypothetical protein